MTPGLFRACYRAHRLAVDRAMLLGNSKPGELLGAPAAFGCKTLAKLQRGDHIYQTSTELLVAGDDPIFTVVENMRRALVRR